MFTFTSYSMAMKWALKSEIYYNMSRQSTNGTIVSRLMLSRLWILFMPNVRHPLNAIGPHDMVNIIWQPQFDESLDDHLIILMKIWFLHTPHTHTHKPPPPSFSSHWIHDNKHTNNECELSVCLTFSYADYNISLFIFTVPPLVSSNSMDASFFSVSFSISATLGIMCVCIMWKTPRDTKSATHFSDTFRHFFLSSSYSCLSSLFLIESIACKTLYRLLFLFVVVLVLVPEMQISLESVFFSASFLWLE